MQSLCREQLEALGYHVGDHGLILQTVTQTKSGLFLYSLRASFYILKEFFCLFFF